MAKQALIKQDGIILEALSNAMFKVKAGKWARNTGDHLWENENELHPDIAG
jgi:hypothetical protein